MNEITELNKEPSLPIKVGNLYKTDDKYYILSQYSKKFFLVNLSSGSTFSGFAESPELAFGTYSKDFSLVNEPIVLTPQINE